MSEQAAVRLAAFDFDGTITQRDTLLGYLIAVGGRGQVLGAGAVRVFSLARGYVSDSARDRAKESMVGAIVRGRSRNELATIGHQYAQSLPQRFRSETIDALRWHQRLGHDTVLVSASLELYLRPLARRLNINDVIGVELEYDEAGYATGRFQQPNVRGRQKQIRLKQWIAERYSAQAQRDIEIWAYGNSSGDNELLAMSDHPTWIGKRAE